MSVCSPHWQLLWHLGIYLLQHIFTAFSRPPSWEYLTYCTDRNSCKQRQSGSKMGRLFALTRYRCRNVCPSPSICERASERVRVFLFTGRKGARGLRLICLRRAAFAGKLLKASWVSPWQFDTSEAKVNCECVAINSPGSLACRTDTRSRALVMPHEQQEEAQYTPRAVYGA